MNEGEKEKFSDKLLSIVLNGRFIVLFFFVLISLFAINYQFDSQGVVINGVTPGGIAESNGIIFDSNLAITKYEEIIYVGNKEVNTLDDFYLALSNYDYNSTAIIRTDKNPSGYFLEVGNYSSEGLLNYLGFSVRDKASSNIRLGIELEGGSRLILSPVSELDEEQYTQLVNNLQSRLDVYGASGTKVNKLEDAFSSEKYVIVESISSNKNDIFELIKQAGKFEAKIGNETVFTGDNVLRVLNDPSHEILQGCNPSNGNYVCTYAFSMAIDSEGVNNFFEASSNLDVVGGYLSEKVAFYLDGKLITELNIASTFKYNKVTNPQITVSGNPMPTQDRALESAQKEVDFLQAILSTSSLPSELDVVQSYSISSSLGKTLLDNAVIVGFASLLIVSSVIAIRYRHPAIFVGIFIALATEVIIVFGIAAFMKLSIDLAAIGGLIAAIGTGVDDQVIITDEYFRKRKKDLSSRKKIKYAIYIIMIAYFTTLAAMLPLMFAGLNILKGFAFMILIGVTVGVLITRPAYAQYLRIVMTTKAQRKEEDEE